VALLGTAGDPWHDDISWGLTLADRVACDDEELLLLLFTAAFAVVLIATETLTAIVAATPNFHFPVALTAFPSPLL
jgi:hypothetical protein